MRKRLRGVPGPPYTYERLGQSLSDDRRGGPQAVRTNISVLQPRQLISLSI